MELLKYKCVQKELQEEVLFPMEGLERVRVRLKTILVLTMTSQVSKGFR